MMGKELEKVEEKEEEVQVLRLYKIRIVIEYHVFRSRV